MNVPRFAMKVEYDGRPFHGWQRQTAHASVQGAIEQALAKLQPGDHTIAAAGRTDAGVHATGQVAHVDLDRDWDPYRLGEALNYHLKPAPVAIIDCAQVPDDWHARFSARERHYRFRLIQRRAPLTVDMGLAWQVPFTLDLQAMREGASYLVGHHDFTTFRSSICQANNALRTLDSIDIEEYPYSGGAEFRFSIRARSFLHNQVRSMVGTLERVGAGSWAPRKVQEALEARSRAACGPVCPPFGLSLAGVGYPDAPFDGDAPGPVS